MKSASLSARYWIGSFVGWTIFGAASATVALEMGGAFSFNSFCLEMLFWYTMAAGTPLVFWLAERYPIEWKNAGKRVLFHFGMAALYLFLYAGIRTMYDSFHPAHPLATDPELGFVKNYTSVLRGSLRIVHFDYWALLGIGHAINYYRKYREREKEAADLAVRTSQLEAQLVRAQLQALRMQLNPHFLFNTLHSIAGLVRESRKQEAIRMIAGLGDLLRQTLDFQGAQEVSLKQEMEFLEKYLDIEQIRFQDRLRIRIEVEPQAWTARVPYLILQPLVENAIRHGISRSSEASLLEIRSWLTDGKLHMQVRDDGPGLPENWNGEGSANVGIRNTRERLSGMYRNDQQFFLENGEGGGVVATITIPFQPWISQQVEP